MKAPVKSVVHFLISLMVFSITVIVLTWVDIFNNDRADHFNLNGLAYIIRMVGIIVILLVVIFLRKAQSLKG